MNDLNFKDYGFRPKAAALLNNEKFSDVEIQVSDGTVTRFPAHKLFLSMNSEVFAEKFYGRSPPQKVIKIFDFKPKIVFMMLEYLYTDKVNFTDTQEARELYTLSKKYKIRNLQELCVDHISRKEINKDNVLNMYECAYKHKYLKCLDFCRQVVSSNTKAVMESPSFVEASLAVLEDILKLDTLTVDNELDIINAVIKWAFHQCKKHNFTGSIDRLRECIFPLLCHIRFLNLDYNQFCDVEKYPIFTSDESSLITSKLLQPDKLVHLPSYICQYRKPRMYSSLSHNSTDNKELDLGNFNPSFPVTGKNSTNKDLKQIPVSKVAPQINISVRKTFDFSLTEAEKLVSTAFKNDVKCSVSIHLLKGMIIIHGIELRISQSHKTGEIINVFLNTSNGRRNSLEMSDTFNEELKDNKLTLMFDHPMKILENNQAEIEVTIEDLKLNRCGILKDPVCKLYCSDTIANISLASNQTNELGDNFFLISCLIYSLV